jgi:hypothetical protein
MTSIPANQLVQSIGSVIGTGGNALNCTGMVLDNSTLVPVGTFASFASATAVGAYFGLASSQYAFAQVYFGSFTTANSIPAALMFVQYNTSPVSAYLRGGFGVSLAAVQGITSGSISIAANGATYTASGVNLSGSSSLSAAAATLQTALQASEPTEASVTGAIAAASASVTASISGNVMTVTAVGSGTLVVGGTLSGTGIPTGLQIASQITGTTGGVGTYTVSVSDLAVVSGTVTQAAGTLTVSAVSSGTLAVGQVLTGTGVTVGTTVVAFGTGTGLTGTYIVSISQTVASETITASGPALNVTYSSLFGAFVVTSTEAGPGSVITYATGGLATTLALTSALGAVLSQGAADQTPSAFMANLIAITQNWVSFTTIFEPVQADKIAFSAWCTAQGPQYWYVCWDSDIGPTQALPATTSTGYLIGPNGSNSSGTTLIYLSVLDAAFAMSWAASLNFNQIAGAKTLAYKQQAGLNATVSNLTASTNLLGNGYNFYGQYAERTGNFVCFQNGSVTGGYGWADAYVYAIWLNASIQSALISLLLNIGQIVYDSDGYQIISETIIGQPISGSTSGNGPVLQAIAFGAISPGTTLSSAQIQTLNAQVSSVVGGVVAVDQTIYSLGYYLYIQDPGPSARGLRQTPIISLWYTQGGSVQQITVNAIELQ